MRLLDRLMDQAGDGTAGAAAGATKDDGAAAGTADAGKPAAGAGTVLDAGKAAAGAAADAGHSADAGAAGKDGAAADAGAAKAYWPADWLAKVSKGDEKLAKQFGQYASPEALAEAHIALRKRMDSGQFVSKLAPNAKPEEIAAWRKDNGIPEAADKYDLTGVQVEAADKPIVDSFLKAAHEANMTPAQVKAAVAWRTADLAAQQAERLKMDEDHRKEALDSLNTEYGPQFRANITRMENLLNLFPESVRDALKGARLADGRGMFNSADAIRGFIAIERMLNPAGVVVPAGGDMVKGALEEYQGIQKMIREKRQTYDKDENMQARFRTLTDHLLKEGRIDSNGNVISDTRKAA